MVRRFKQKFGQNCGQIFSPVVRFDFFTTLMAVAAKYGLKLQQIDVATALFHRFLVDVFFKRLDGFAKEGEVHLMFRLKPSSQT